MRAMPPRAEARSPGCVAAVLVYAALCLYLYWTTPVWWFLAFATPALLGLGVFTVNELIGILLLAQSRRVFEAQGVRCLLVYSESPLWEDYIRDKWLSRLGRSAATLNWSHRSRWPPSIEV